MSRKTILCILLSTYEFIAMRLIFQFTRLKTSLMSTVVKDCRNEYSEKKITDSIIREWKRNFRKHVAQQFVFPFYFSQKSILSLLDSSESG